MVTIAPGRYIVAVSGGVDSMVLTDMLRRGSGLTLVVAHVDHGIRADAAKDTALVESYAKQHGLLFATTKLNLGPGAPEAAARQARYDFLQHCRKKYNAQAIVTAHHQDDLIETALLAFMRGTGWRGLAPFMPQKTLLRPLLEYTKDQLIGYARAHHIAWHEDPTNHNEAYTRNYIRRTLIPLLDQKSDTWRAKFLQHIRKQQKVRAEIEVALDDWLRAFQQPGVAALRRYGLVMLPNAIGYEMVQRLAQHATGNTLERPLAEAALLFAKTGRPGKVMELGTNWQLRAQSANVIVEPRRPVVSLK